MSSEVNIQITLGGVSPVMCPAFDSFLFDIDLW